MLLASALLCIFAAGGCSGADANVRPLPWAFITREGGHRARIYFVTIPAVEIRRISVRVEGGRPEVTLLAHSPPAAVKVAVARCVAVRLPPAATKGHIVDGAFHSGKRFDPVLRSLAEGLRRSVEGAKAKCETMP